VLHHEFADDVAVPSFGPRMVCTVWGANGADARPNWNERAPVSLFGRNCQKHVRFTPKAAANWVYVNMM